jgi:hypothetical protein
VIQAGTEETMYRPTGGTASPCGARTDFEFYYGNMAPILGGFRRLSNGTIDYVSTVRGGRRWRAAGRAQKRSLKQHVVQAFAAVGQWGKRETSIPPRALKINQIH